MERLGGAVSSAEDDARRRAEALRERLAAQQAQLDETQAHLETTQARLAYPATVLIPRPYARQGREEPHALADFAVTSHMRADAAYEHITSLSSTSGILHKFPAGQEYAMSVSC